MSQSTQEFVAEVIKKLQKQFSRAPAKAALIFLVGLFLLSVFIPYVSPYGQDTNGAVHFKIAGQAPSFSHWFGTDAAGRDVF